MTGFEGTLIGGMIIGTLLLLLWRALDRLHVTVNNTNSSNGVVTAGEPIGQGASRARSVIGLLISLGIIVAVIALAVAAFDLRESISTTQPDQMTAKVITPIPDSAPAPIEVPAEYAPVALPSVNTAFDPTPIVLLAIMAAALWFVARRTSRPAQIRHVHPVVIAAPIPISADRPLQDVMSDRKS